MPGPPSGFQTYPSDIDDNRRWLEFALRDGDVVVSTRSKHGTTWTQLICLLLVRPDLHDAGGLAEPMGHVSPWVDFVGEPLAALQERLDAQQGRRVLKTHTPLDGVAPGGDDGDPDARASWVVVARHPLDAAVSLYHQGDNIDRDEVARRTGRPAAVRTRPRPPVADWLREWALDDDPPEVTLDSPRGVLHHVIDAWDRVPDGPRAGAATVVLVHYADLLARPHPEIARLATALGVTTSRARIEEIVAATGFATMRADAAALAPDPGLFHEPRAFFRDGGSARGRDLLTDVEQAAFEARCRRLAPDVVVDWLLR